MAPVVRAAPRAVLVAAGVVLGRLVVQQPSFVLCLARRLGGLARSGGLRLSIYAAVSQQSR